MNCVDLDRLLDACPSQNLNKSGLSHIRKCPRCSEKYGLDHILHVISSGHVEVPEEKPTGEKNFLETLEILGKTQTNSFERAQFLNDTIQRGDRWFWRGEYGRAAREYREALMVVQDDQGKVALQNKLARAQIHRHQDKEAVELLSEALEGLGEPPPPERFLNLHIIREEIALWALQLRYYLAEQWPQMFPLSTQFGDRSKAAQHLYRELSTLAQNHNSPLSEWAHCREMQWATKLNQPLEQIVTWGRKAVANAQKNRHWRANFWLQRINKVATKDDPITQASADFYIGRAAYIMGRWNNARFHLERCVKLSQSARDSYLRDAALQHLIRVYRNDGNFADAVRIASQLLNLYHKLGNLPRLSACCRHFALIYAAYGDLRLAKRWANKALEVSEQSSNATQEQSLSQVRCFVLLGDIEYRCGREESARLYIGEAIRIQRQGNLPLIYLRDGLDLLRKIRGERTPQRRLPLWTRITTWFAQKWAIMRGDLELAHHLHQRKQLPSGEQQIPSELAYLYQENLGLERPGGLRKAIPASPFACQFLTSEIPVRPEQSSFSREADQIASMFPVGAVSSRWGRGALSRDQSGAITTQLSNGADAPWGYFFADDIS